MVIGCRLKDLIQCRQALAMRWGKVLMARSRIKLMRQAYESEKSSQQHGIYYTIHDYIYIYIIILLYCGYIAKVLKN